MQDVPKAFVRDKRGFSKLPFENCVRCDCCAVQQNEIGVYIRNSAEQGFRRYHGRAWEFEDANARLVCDHEIGESSAAVNPYPYHCRLCHCKFPARYVWKETLGRLRRV